MAEVTLTIGGRQYAIHCGDGEEAHLDRLAKMIDAKTGIARQASPGLTEVRQLLFAAILLADEVHDMKIKTEKPQGSLELPPASNEAGEEVMASRMNVLAARIEALADKLAGAATTS
ncbi:MAG: cell division protein ZapA [Sphingobium sp.]|jgi:cell division protein ZapA|nr:cell division protein ZapA [Sphingobium sp.]MCP5397868.1 cell division protein ZapA [Sphingomonas sp.]